MALNGKPVRYYVDRHELGLFERSKMLQYMREAGLKSTLRRDGLMPGRGLLIGVKR